MKKIKIIALTIVFVITFVASCSSPTTSSEPSAVNLPTPNPDKSLIYGVLINESSQKPVLGDPFLAYALIPENPDLPVTVSFSMQSNPGAEYDIESGRFYFDDIEPGDNYVIILVYGPGNFVVVEEPSSQAPLIISVSAGESLDMGTIYVTEQIPND